MITRRKLQSRLINTLLSPRVFATRRWITERRRRLLGRPHLVSVFLELDDPYSYLLSQFLPDLSACYEIELQLHLTQALGDAFRPRADMLAVYAERDCERLARELGVPFLDKGRAPPVENRRALIDALADSEGKANFSDELLEAIGLYWRGDSEGVARRVSGADLTGRGEALLEKSQQLLAQLGHYNSATIHYAGEWYWGVDRLHYLIKRLDVLGARREGSVNARLASIRQAMQVALPITPPGSAKDLPPLEYFYSFRSPYSYLSLRRVYDIADAFGLELKIRPVLPMLMRGMQIPKSKLIYIATDTTREAQRLDIPFGKFVDPIGRGTERCMAAFFYALGEKRERDFLLHAGEAIWARGIDVASDKGMRKVTARTGLFWPDVKMAMQDEAWREVEDENREAMMESGSWGVPTMRLGDAVFWGQDRDWLLVRHIEELCDPGDGILV
ncbi:MAG: DsbA family protein [Proteobacteria bacterium]|nr:DsbA family protein [Pseudomonadota bacterium]